MNEVVNLDCMDYDELERYAIDILEDGENQPIGRATREKLSQYATSKYMAHNYRAQGNIIRAFELEQDCQWIYLYLPKKVKW